MDRKYSVAEIERMRRSVRDLMMNWQWNGDGSGSAAGVKDEDVEARLQTYMLNGTDPEELEKQCTERREAAIAAAKEHEEHMAEYRRNNPPPKPRDLLTKEDVIDEWYQTCVAKYKDASVTARELFDGFGGRTLMSFANQNAPDGVHIKQSDMERYLEKKGVKSRSAMFAKRYDGIRHIIHGNVRSGNYGT